MSEDTETNIVLDVCVCVCVCVCVRACVCVCVYVWETHPSSLSKNARHNLYKFVIKLPKSSKWLGSKIIKHDECT